MNICYSTADNAQALSVLFVEISAARENTRAIVVFTEMQNPNPPTLPSRILILWTVFVNSQSWSDYRNVLKIIYAAYTRKIN